MATDRRIRIPKEEHINIKARHSDGSSIRSLATEYGVSRRAIQFIVYPERLKTMLGHRENRRLAKKK